MKPKSPEAIKQAALERQNGKATPKADPRKAITLNLNGALINTCLRALSESREVDAALRSFMEAGGLEGGWLLRITAAELTPSGDRA